MTRGQQVAGSAGKWRRAAGLAAAVLLVGALTEGAASAASAVPSSPAVGVAATPACPGWVAVRPPDPGPQLNDLLGLDVLSAKNVWAVGDYTGADGTFKTLVEHWNGKAWSRVPSPDPGTGSNYLDGVANKTLILHWNGRAWSKAAAGPSGSDLVDVSVSSATNGWAVGSDAKGLSLAMRWNGRAWKRVATPNLKPGQLTNALQSVTAVSPTSAWAVGYAEDLFNFDSTAIEMHWNGHAWSKMASPAPGGTSALYGVRATSTVSPWAVGEYGLTTQVQRTLAFRCR